MKKKEPELFGSIVSAEDMLSDRLSARGGKKVCKDEQ